MNDYLRKKLRIIIILLIVNIIFLSIDIFSLNYTKDFDNKINYCRVLTSKLMNNIERSYVKGNIEDINENKYEYSIIALDGKIINTTEKGYYEGKVESLKQDLAFDNWYEENNPKNIRYSAPLIVHKKIVAIVRVIIPKDEIISISNSNRKAYLIAFAILLSIIILYLLYKIYKLINVDILEPISKMHKSAKRILQGDFSEKISYDYYGEIGSFSHDFEAMRDGLRAAKDMEQKLKNSEKELIACISHDLKTPIASISGYCEGIIDGVVQKEKDIKRYSNIILKKARVLTKLIDDMLEFSKAEINQMTINKEEIYWKDFFIEVLEDLSIDVESTGRRFNIEGDISNIIINVDKKRIQQVLYNLVSNSIKYTKADGSIIVINERTPEYLIITVKDNGVGIGKGEIPYVFNKFYRGEKHRNLDIPGSGLGLSISKYIVEHHGGSIQIKSSTEYGTEVTFNLKIL